MTRILSTLIFSLITLVLAVFPTSAWSQHDGHGRGHGYSGHSYGGHDFGGHSYGSYGGHNFGGGYGYGYGGYDHHRFGHYSNGHNDYYTHSPNYSAGYYRPVPSYFSYPSVILTQPSCCRDSKVDVNPGQRMFSQPLKYQDRSIPNNNNDNSGVLQNNPPIPRSSNPVLTPPPPPKVKSQEKPKHKHDHQHEEGKSGMHDHSNHKH